jgi:hypothetical protein
MLAPVQHESFSSDKPRGASPGLGWYGMYKFLLVTNFGGHQIEKRGEHSAGYRFTIDRETNPLQATLIWS